MAVKKAFCNKAERNTHMEYFIFLLIFSSTFSF